ncbi:MAG: hypothetical protein B7X39_19995 [Lysobacterales bacterium 14-68-21]|jgi:hypothetical protein|nr:MAG: hypothetical protein B7X45_14015 [Xanthomonadales bacterium 15-68-25]OZB63227.1 MAG: hypothetical protein B7X39_19995 [Xanthomonadales bacterium 14-68-21]
MVRFLAVKIHYDHRGLPAHNKYSRPASANEYDEYNAPVIRGGEGFHECMNFMLREDEDVKLYLPPTAIPGSDKAGDEFVIFWFTYKADREKSAQIVGVHGGAVFVTSPIQDVIRKDVAHLSGRYKWVYQATAPEELATLLVPSIPYDSAKGRHMPVLENWGNGRRYLDKRHAANILSDALRGARQRLEHANVAERVVVKREIDVILRLADRYAMTLKTDQRTERQKKAGAGKFSLPDKELGELGEKVVYEREVAYAKSIGVSPSRVDWTSKQAPQSPFDIKTIRKVGGKIRDHFLEVKSSRVNELGGNTFLSIYQLQTIEEYGEAGEFVFVRFDGIKAVSVDFMTVEQMKKKFSLAPIKFRLTPKTD